MQETGVHNGAFGADKFGLKNLKGVHWNYGAPQLYEHALRNGEAVLSADGALCADTGEFTGRSPKDKFTVRDGLTDKSMWWAGNQSITSEQFATLHADFIKHAEGMTLFAQDLYGGADPKHRIKTRVFTELAWHVHGSMSSLIDVEDLVQIGLVTLVEAAASFEDRGLVSFDQYLQTRVRGAMIDELRRQATITRGAMKRLIGMSVPAATSSPCSQGFRNGATRRSTAALISASLSISMPSSCSRCLNAVRPDSLPSTILLALQPTSSARMIS